MHFALLFLQFRCHSRIANFFDYNRAKIQYITMQEFRFMTICVRLKGVRSTGVDCTLYLVDAFPPRIFGPFLRNIFDQWQLVEPDTVVESQKL